MEAGGCVGVSASEDDGVLAISICDNGAGLGGASSPGSGTGIRNTRERLWHAYGDDASLEVADQAEGGVCVSVRLPIRRDPDHDPWDDT